MRQGLSRSLWWKVVATLVAVSVFVLAYEATTSDSHDELNATAGDPTAPVIGAQLQFQATAYCKGRTTASGVVVRSGVAAADPRLLPVGSVLTVTTDTAKYNGIYTVMDTGPAVQGRIVDLYMWSCYEALDFGRKAIQLTVLRMGWNPSASTPSLVDRLFHRREAARRTATPVPAAIPEGPLPETAVPPPDEPAPESAPADLDLRAGTRPTTSASADTKVLPAP